MFSSNTSQVAATATQAEAIDFDGTNDYLSRSSDLTGNTNSTTLTFSMFFWTASSAVTQRYYGVYDGTEYRFEIYRSAQGQVIVNGYNLSNSPILGFSFYLTTAGALLGTFVNLLFSLDLSNSAKRHVFINDTDNTSNVTWSTYSFGAINFSRSIHNIASSGIGTQLFPGRLSNVYLDYTYRDLSITANRRLFVTADLKPAAGQAALNPIMYLPMSDPTQPGLNQGTGGNFTLTGTVARSGRGPNQYNAPYSTLNASTRYMSRSAITGITSGKTFTFNCSINRNTTSGSPPGMLTISTGGVMRFSINVLSNRLEIRGTNDSGNLVVRFLADGSFVVGRNYVITISVDLTSTAKRWVYLNGVAVAGSWTQYLNTAIDFGPVPCNTYVGTDETNSVYLNSNLGALWFNTSYIDLSVAANLAKFVTGTGIDAKPVDLGANGELPTGTSPLIYLPMYGNNAGKNYGTGGDFTANSGPYPGARGPNEFWGNKAQFDGSTGYLARDTGITGLASSKTFSMSFWCSPDVSGTSMRVISGNAGGTDNRLNIIRQTTNDLAIVAKNSSGTIILEGYTTAVFTAGASCYVQIAIDMSSTAKRFVYINGVANSVSWLTYTDDVIDFTPLYWTIGASYFNGSRNLFFNGKISEFYFTNEYIDFSQEANRLKFRDAFGNPVDLTQQIEDAAIPNPAIYMRFPPTAFGTNYGTGGNFTVNGTITDAGQL